MGRTIATNGSADVNTHPLHRMVEEVGSLTTFSAQVIRQVPAAARLYPSEVMRQVGLLIRKNGVLILLMCFLVGVMISIVLHYLGVSLGLGSYIGGMHTLGSFRGVLEVAFGWIIAAKIGCGIVAEIGAMRINDEIDAMEVMGIRSIAYLASSRLIATLIVIPIAWPLALWMYWAGDYIIHVKLLHSVSPGAFWYFTFLFQSPGDFILVLAWATMLIVIIVLVSSFYGFTASGGPVGVGRSTARSMVVNLMLISTVYVAMVQLFWGNSPNAPIAN